MIWIFCCKTAETLTRIALKQNYVDLQKWLKPVLLKMTKDKRKPVASKGKKLLEQL